MKYYKLILSLFVIVVMMVPRAESQALAEHQDDMLQKVAIVKQQADIQLYLKKKLDIEIRDAALKQILQQVEKKTGANLVYRNELVDEYSNMSIKQKNKTLENVLSVLLEETDLEYVATGSYIIIREKPRPVKRIVETVSGTVTDAETSEPMPGVNIAVKGTTTGTSTGSDGTYSLGVPSLQDTLIFSFVGYRTLEVPINGRTEISISLDPMAISGEDIVVVGYGQQQRRDITSSISSVSAEDIANEPVTQVAQSLQGKVSGVQINRNSGNPGDDFRITVRGVGSVNNRSTEPLYVVDGNPMVDPEDISPSQVQSIEILKSASATAIYGARGANGVVLISTKEGRSMEGVQFDLDFYEGVSYARRVPFTNAREFATLYNEALTNAGQTPIYPNAQQLGEGTDWQDVAYRPAYTENINMSISGGNENSTYNISGQFEDQEGVVRATNYRRLNLRLNSQHQINDFIRIGENISYNRTRSSNQGTYTSISFFARQIAASPAAPIYNEDGSFANLPQQSNLEAMFQRQEDQEDDGTARGVLTGSGFVEISPLDNLTFRSQYNFVWGEERFRDFVPTYNISTTDRNELSSITRNETFWNNWNLENTLNYQDTFGDHNVEALVGITAQENFGEFWQASVNDLPANSTQFEGLRYLDLGDSGQDVSGNGGGFAMLSYLGRINYDFDDRYLATINYRIDGSSRFGENNRYGYFPSFSLGWRISSESFMEDADFVNNLLIRGGWGQIGNQEPLDNYAYASSVSRGMNYYLGDTWIPGQAPEGAGNPNLKWEAIEETNIGLSFTGFDNRVTVDMDYYNKITTDMLMEVPVVGYSGIAEPPFRNAGEIQNQGFELALGYQQTTPGDFYYSINANVSYNKNEVTSLANNVEQIFGEDASFIGSGFLTQAAPGNPVAMFYGYVEDGIFQTQSEIDNHATQPGAAPGDLRFKDLNNDGEITADDKTNIGNPWPDYTFGLNASFAYKNFDLNLGFSGQYGNDIFAAWKWTWYGGNWFNSHENALNRWQQPGDNTDIPRLHISDPNANLRPSSWYVEDGSYLRLNNVQLGYNLPESVLGGLGLRELRIYATATNVFTITGYEGQDPELGTPESTFDGNLMYVGIDWGHFAVPKTYSIGINIGL